MGPPVSIFFLFEALFRFLVSEEQTFFKFSPRWELDVGKQDVSSRTMSVGSRISSLDVP